MMTRAVTEGGNAADPVRRPPWSIKSVLRAAAPIVAPAYAWYGATRIAAEDRQRTCIGGCDRFAY